MPEAYKSLDTDLDGQIALYEWRKGTRGPLSQFATFDSDQDGFLTPKELHKATLVQTPVTPSGPISTETPATTNAPPTAPPAPVEVSAAAAAKATRSFNLLDKDNSGTIVGAEWDASTRLKPLFEKGGVDFAKPLNKDDFIQAFVRVGG